MKDYQTPQKEHSRYSDIANRRSKDSQLKKPQKVPKQSLNGAFSLVSEDFSPQISKESSDFSPISESSAPNHSSLLAESSVLVASPTLSASSETFPLPDLTPTSKNAAITDESGNASAVHYENNKLESLRISPVEADVVVNLLKQAQTQVFNSTDMDDVSKKLLKALIEDVIKQFCNLPAETDSSTDLVSRKARIVLVFFLAWNFAVSMIFFLFGFGFDPSYHGPSPT